MDLNYLYLRRQVSLVRADRAACEASRSAHLGLAGLYGALIERERDQKSAPRGGQRFGLALAA
jgi:hypothetical protein